MSLPESDVKEPSNDAISALEELCVYRKWAPPKYEEFFASAPGYEPEYWYRVKVCGIYYSGFGKTKECAMVGSAQKALDELNQMAKEKDAPAPSQQHFTGMVKVPTAAESQPFGDLPSRSSQPVQAQDRPVFQEFTIVCGQYMPQNMRSLNKLKRAAFKLPGVLRLQGNHVLSPIPDIPEPYIFKLQVITVDSILNIDSYATSLLEAEMKAYAKLCVLKGIKITRGEQDCANEHKSYRH